MTETTRDRPLEANELDEEVTFTKGELEDLEETRRSSAIARTSVQVGTPAAIVGIGSWLARLHGIDLDPGAVVDLPADVAGYLVAVLAGLFAWGMNRKQ